MPGGFEQASLTLPRKPAVDYPDLAEFSKVTILGAGGQVAWQGRLETTPRTSGNQLAISRASPAIRPPSRTTTAAREIYIDCDLTKWQGPSVQRQITLTGIGYALNNPAVSPDATTGQPSLVATNTGAWAAGADSEALYDANRIPLASCTTRGNAARTPSTPTRTGSGRWSSATMMCKPRMTPPAT